MITGAGHPEALQDKVTRCPSLTVWEIDALFISGATAKRGIKDGVAYVKLG